jgi:dihydropteroate synthase
MGILNLTPDSFFSGSRVPDVYNLLTRAEKMLASGADFLDVGGYSSRPGADHISESEELSRVVPAINALSKEFPDALLSVDTFRAQVADAALDAGAALVNDISAGEQDNQMLATVARHGAPFVCMHMRGTPQTMQQHTQYENLVFELIDFSQHKLAACREAGIKDIIIDPGFGFAKTVEQNFDLLAHLERLNVLGVPLLVGLSRKSMVWRTLQTDAQGALNGSTALHMVALQKGASILRVHDVKEAKETITLFQHLHQATVNSEIV